MRTQAKPAYPPRAATSAPRQSAHIVSSDEFADIQHTPSPHIVAAIMHDRQRRSMTRVVEQVLFEAGRMADEYYYSWKAGKDRETNEDKFVEGCTIGGAEMLMRNWGNCTCLPRLIEEDATHWLFEATFVDVEQGVAYPRLFRQRKSEQHQRGDEERLMDIAFQIGQSKAIRNAILAGLPGWLEDDARAAAKKASALKYQDVADEWPKFLAKLAKRGVTEAQVRTRLGLVPGDRPTAENLALLAAIGRSIRDRQTTIEVEFSGVSHADAMGDEAAEAVAEAARAAPAAPSAPAPVAERPKSGEKKTAASAAPPASATPPAPPPPDTPPPATPPPAEPPTAKE